MGTAPNPLTRVPVAFATDTISRHLAPLAGTDPAVVILEGVTMYLTDPVLQDLAAAVRAALPRATLICDLMSPGFARRYGREIREELTRLGARFADRSTHPRHAIEAAGYAPSRVASIIRRARRAGTVALPHWLLATLLRELRDGYAVWTFAPTA